MKTLDWDETKAYAQRLSVSQLRYTIKDCREAAQAMKGWNPNMEGYYADEASVYADELRNRRRGHFGSLAKANEFIGAEWPQARMGKGKGYFYFTGPYNIPNIRAASLKEVTVGQIIDAVEDAKQHHDSWASFRGPQF